MGAMINEDRFGVCAVSAADTLAITFGNTTAAPIDPPTESYLLFYFRPEKTFAQAVF